MCFSWYAYHHVYLSHIKKQTLSRKSIHYFSEPVLQPYTLQQFSILDPRCGMAILFFHWYFLLPAHQVPEACSLHCNSCITIRKPNGTDTLHSFVFLYCFLSDRK